MSRLSLGCCDDVQALVVAGSNFTLLLTVSDAVSRPPNINNYYFKKSIKLIIDSYKAFHAVNAARAVVFISRISLSVSSPRGEGLSGVCAAASCVQTWACGSNDNGQLGTVLVLETSCWITVHYTYFTWHRSFSQVASGWLHSFQLNVNKKRNANVCQDSS